MDNYRVVIYRRNLKKTKLALELVLLVLRSCVGVMLNSV
jgi:hypothetical protein